MQDLHENYRLFLHLEELGDLHPPKKKDFAMFSKSMLRSNRKQEITNLYHWWWCRHGTKGVQFCLVVLIVQNARNYINMVRHFFKIVLLQAFPMIMQNNEWKTSVSCGKLSKNQSTNQPLFSIVQFRFTKVKIFTIIHKCVVLWQMQKTTKN